MKYKVIRNCIASGKKARVGDVVELCERDSFVLLNTGRVVPHEEPVVEEAPVELEVKAVKKAPVTRKNYRGRKPQDAG